MGAAASIVVAIVGAAGCGESGPGEGSSAAAGRSGTEVELDPYQTSEPGGSSASAGAAGSSSLSEPPLDGTPLDGPDDEGPPAGLPARGVSDFDREAQQATPRADDARGLGGACASTFDCRTGLGCADVVFSGAGQSFIAGGYCSRWCEQDADCAGLEPGSFCSVQHFGSDLNFCAKPCLTGDTDGAEKCGGRADLVCGVLRAPGVEALCTPRCSSNADCARGHCSSWTGFCEVGLPALTLPPGTPCSSNSSCDGFCAPSSPGSSNGVCSGVCRLGSSCGEGPASVCAPEYRELREGDGGNCEQACNSTEDCPSALTACAPTGFIAASGEPQNSCGRSYSQPASLAPQRLSVEGLALAALPSSIVNVSTTSIFEALSHRLSVEDGAVCVSGDVIGDFGALLELDFQIRPNNGLPLAAPGLSAVTFDAQGPHVVRFDVYTSSGYYRFLNDPNTAGDIGEGPQRIGVDQLFDIYSQNAPLQALEAPELEALSFSLILDDGPGPFRFCVKNLALEVTE